MIVPIEELDDALRRIVNKVERRVMLKANFVMRESAISTFGEIIDLTPVGDFDPDHEGTLKANWQATANEPAVGQVNRQDPNRDARSDMDQALPRAVLKKNLYLTNNLPYAGVVEFGGYPKRVRFGTFNKKTGQYEIRSAGGFSKQAPRGMVRISVRRWRRGVQDLAPLARRRFGG